MRGRDSTPTCEEETASEEEIRREEGEEDEEEALDVSDMRGRDVSYQEIRRETTRFRLARNRLDSDLRGIFVSYE